MESELCTSVLFTSVYMYRKEGTELCTSVLYAAVDMYRKEGPRVLTLNTVLSQSPFYGVKLLYDYGFWSLSLNTGG
jgi:hypothetical protein